MDLPKVLIIGQSFCDIRGGGITMMNLFSQWDKERLAVACTGHFLSLKINASVCDTYYQLGEKEQKLKFPFNLFQKKFKSGPVKPSSLSNEVGFSRPSPDVRQKFVNKILYPFLEYIGMFHNLSRIDLSKEFCEWLNNYQPDIIYAQAYSLEGVRFCIKVKDYLKKPMAFHMMDDWPSSSSERGPFKKIWAKEIDLEFKILLGKSSLLLSISEEMSKEYKRRYAKEFVPFHNPINVVFWKTFQKKEYDLNKKPYIYYSGRIGIGIDSSLKVVAEAVEKVNREMIPSMKFVLSSEEKPDWIHNYSSTEHKKFVVYKDVPKALSDADILLLPYDFSSDSINFIKYSMPTKASEYMMSGTPTILFAPSNTAIVNYAKKYNCFEIVTKNNVEAISTAIKNLLADKYKRKHLAETASLIAEKDHNADDIASNFKIILYSIRENSLSVPCNS